MARRQIRVLVAAAAVALVLAAMVGSGMVGSGMVGSGSGRAVADVSSVPAGCTQSGACPVDAGSHDGRPCHEQVTCAGQLAAASALPLVPLATVLGVLAFASAPVRSRAVRWRDRLASGRLFRPPRLLV